MQKFNKLLIIIIPLLLISCGNNSPEDGSETGTYGQKSTSEQESESSPEEAETGVLYFDSTYTGADGDGSVEKPYNSLAHLENVDFSITRKIKFKTGSLFDGPLNISGLSGTESKPYIFESYGEGDKPKFDGKGLIGSGVLRITNCSNLTVKNLEFYDSDSNEGDKRGVFITGTNDGGEDVISYPNIKLDNLYIHDIRGIKDAENSGMAYASKKTGGILFATLDGKATIDNLDIGNCVIENVDNVGIASYYFMKDNSANKVSPYTEDFYKTAHKNARIHHNSISNIGKNAIFVRNLYCGVVEYNQVHDTAVRCISGNSIVTSYVDGTIIQHNEGYRNLAQYNGSKIQDGCMLDADLQSKDTIWQYNYSHDNSFGLFLNCTSLDENQGIVDKVKVRYNLSVNDKGEKGVIYMNYQSGGVEIYNNTIVTSDATNILLKSNGGTNYNFYNNLIYSRSRNLQYSIEGKYSFSNNLFYSATGGFDSTFDVIKNHNANGLYVDPLFSGELPECAPIGMDDLSVFALSQDSPCYDAGLENDCEEDFFGLSANKNIGFSSNI